MHLKGRTALITGASRGIGRTAAELLASRGARVMCAARGVTLQDIEAELERIEQQISDND